MNSNKKRAIVVLLLLFPLIFAVAREVEIIVRDADLNQPLEGAIIRSWDGAEYAANAQGRLILSVPDDREVIISIAYPGYTNLRLPIPLQGDFFTAPLHLQGLMENQALVIEADRVGSSNTDVGRSDGRGAAIGGEVLSRTAETGLIEDTMTAVKLLPGVGYTGFFDAMPSIRGGEPGDLMAALDGFYIENPYHWDGGFSIFDPRMIENARLSHGVFSARYGNTVSGLLELSSKQPSAENAEFTLGLSTNAADLSLSFPLPSNGVSRGGIMVMGKLTWWQPFIELAHLFMPISRNVKQAPWIASGAVSANYRLNPDLELTLNGYFGGDGIGFSYINDVDEPDLTGTSSMSHFFDNKIGFLNTGLIFNPRNDMLLKASLGAGLNETNAHIDREDKLSVRSVPLEEEEFHHRTDRTIHAQGRVDFDWDLGRALPGLLFAAGAHERYSNWSFNREDSDPGAARIAASSSSASPDPAVDARSDAFFSSAYTLLEYLTPGRKFGAELGLRFDHQFLLGEDDLSLSTAPVFSPRLNLDFLVLEKRGPVEAWNMTAGTGLFSATDPNLRYLEKNKINDDFVLKPVRSWTNLIGTAVDFSFGLRFSVEGYYKLLFDRTVADRISTNETVYQFDGEGRVWGFDLLLQKTESRYWDGWISYSWNDVQYRDIAGWYYPLFHRFHTLNLVLNIKPLERFHIAAHLGFASGKLTRTIKSVSTASAPAADGQLINLYIPVYADEPERTGFSLPLDIKFSWYLYKPNSKVRTEIYLGVENLLGPLLPSIKSAVINPYTGAEETAGGMAVMTELAIPLPSFGVKWSY